MFAIDFDSGIVGLTWPPNLWGNPGKKERVQWRVFGDSVTNIDVETRDWRRLEQVGEGEWVVEDDHGPGSDLIQVENLDKVVIDSVSLSNPPMKVNLNPEISTEDLKAKGGEIIARITNKDTPYTITPPHIFYPAPTTLLTPRNIAIGLGALTAVGLVATRTDIL